MFIYLFILSANSQNYGIREKNGIPDFGNYFQLSRGHPAARNCGTELTPLSKFTSASKQLLFKMVVNYYALSGSYM